MKVNEIRALVNKTLKQVSDTSTSNDNNVVFGAGNSSVLYKYERL